MRQTIRIYRYRLRQHAQRIAIGLRYAMGRTSQADAETMLYECSEIAGDWTLSSFSAGDVIEDALEEYEDTPELRAICKSAARRVWNKWNGSGDEAGAARDWAMDLVREWAGQDGLSGLPSDDEITGAEIKAAHAADLKD